MRRVVCRAVGTLFVLVAAGESRGQSVDDIKQAWQRRQDGIRTMRVTWSEVRTQPKGYFDMLEGRLDAKEPKPPTDLRLPGRGTVTFDDQNFRLEVQRRKWSTKHSKVMDSEEVIAYRGDKNTALTTKSTIIDHPDAEIEKRRRPGDVMEFTYWPITCFARGLNPKFMPFDIDLYEPTGGTPSVDGRRCVELAHKTRANNSRQVVLLDPGREFLLVRYYVVADDQVTTRLDVKYDPDPRTGWLPRSWDYAVSTPTGLRIESKQVTVEACDVGADLAADTFDLRLPPGTRVYDAYDGGAKQYVIRDDGNSGPAVSDADRPTYDRLTDLARREGRWSGSVVATVIAGAALVLAVFALAWRWKRRRPGPSGPAPLS